ncbi:MAG: hypothetical protein HC860_11250 [Alkalinema sp. RU_4_3]|nr:hypothetical protein [Alkalinema sp. RU_4_3]
MMPIQISRNIHSLPVDARKNKNGGNDPEIPSHRKFAQVNDLAVEAGRIAILLMHNSRL